MLLELADSGLVRDKASVVLRRGALLFMAAVPPLKVSLTSRLVGCEGRPAPATLRRTRESSHDSAQVGGEAALIGATMSTWQDGPAGSSPPFVLIVCGFALALLFLGLHWYVRLRLQDIAEALGGHLGWVTLRLRRGSLKFEARPEAFGALELMCREIRARRRLRLRDATGARWPLMRLDSIAADLRARLRMSAELAETLAATDDLEPRLVELTERLRIRFRIHNDGLKLVLRPREAAIEARDLSDVLDWLVALQGRLASTWQAEANPGLLPHWPLPARLLLMLVLCAVWFVPYMFAMRRWPLLTSGCLGRVLWHAVPVSLALVVPLGLAWEHARSGSRASPWPFASRRGPSWAGPWRPR